MEIKKNKAENRGGNVEKYKGCYWKRENGDKKRRREAAGRSGKEKEI